MDAEAWRLMQEAGSYLPPHVKPWAYWMQFSLFLLPLLFVKYWPPRILIVAQLVNVAIAFAVFVFEGQQVTRLFGVGHFVWLVPLWLLVRDASPVRSKLYRGFIAVAATTISISLVFDARDLALWLGGERGSVLVGVPEGSPLAPSGQVHGRVDLLHARQPVLVAGRLVEHLADREGSGVADLRTREDRLARREALERFLEAAAPEKRLQREGLESATAAGVDPG